MVTEQRLRNIINEELTKTEVTRLVSDKISSEYNSREFESKVREIVSDVIETLYRTLWNRSSTWKTQLRK